MALPQRITCSFGGGKPFAFRARSSTQVPRPTAAASPSPTTAAIRRCPLPDDGSAAAQGGRPAVATRAPRLRSRPSRSILRLSIDCCPKVNGCGAAAAHVPREVAAGVRYEDISFLREHNAAWRLLRADNAPLVLSFLQRVFVDGNARSVAAAELISQLDDELYALNDRLGEATSPSRRGSTSTTGHAGAGVAAQVLPRRIR
jgi:Protein of unknown function (DUF3375)